MKVGAIRLKHDGLKVFAFAETESVEEIEKAKGSMEGVEIQGRKLRVRSSKDTDKKKRVARETTVRKEEKKEQIEKEDVKKHLVAAFISFLEREFESESVDEQFKELIDAAKSSLSTAYDLPEDDSLNIPKQIEDIFFREAKHLVKIEKPDIKKEIKEENAEDNEEFEEGDDDGNWKRRGNSKSRDTEESSEHEDSKKDGLEGSMEVEDNLEDELNPADDNEDEIVRDEDHDLLVNV